MELIDYFAAPRLITELADGQAILYDSECMYT